MQNAIGARQVKYDSVYNEKTEANLKTTNDKLWLFSMNELANTIKYGYYNHPLEGSVYKKFESTRDDGCDSSGDRFSFRLGSLDGDSIGTEGMTWLRSLYSLYSWEDCVMYMDSFGYARYLYPYREWGVSFGFTLKR